MEFSSVFNALPWTANKCKHSNNKSIYPGVFSDLWWRHFKEGSCSVARSSRGLRTRSFLHVCTMNQVTTELHTFTSTSEILSGNINSIYKQRQDILDGKSSLNTNNYEWSWFISCFSFWSCWETWCWLSDVSSRCVQAVALLHKKVCPRQTDLVHFQIKLQCSAVQSQTSGQPPHRSGRQYCDCKRWKWAT